LNEDLLFVKHLGQQVHIAKLLGEEETLHQPPLTTSTHYKAIRRRSSCHPHSTKSTQNKAMGRISLIFITRPIFDKIPTTKLENTLHHPTIFEMASQTPWASNQRSIKRKVT
jgi:hypothetical protein